MKGFTSNFSLANRFAKYCVGLTFVGGLSAVIVYATHGWSWPSRINGLTISLPEFVTVVVLVTLGIGVCVDYWRAKQPSNSV